MEQLSKKLMLLAPTAPLSKWKSVRNKLISYVIKITPVTILGGVLLYLLTKKRIDANLLQIENWERTNELDALPLLVGSKERLMFCVDQEDLNAKTIKVFAGEIQDLTPVSLIFIYAGKFFHVHGKLTTLDKRKILTTNFLGSTLFLATDFYFKEEPKVLIEGWKAEALLRILTVQIRSGRKIQIKVYPKKIALPMTEEELQQADKAYQRTLDSYGFKNEGEI